jgi:hypothetical protein
VKPSQALLLSLLCPKTSISIKIELNAHTNRHIFYWKRYSSFAVKPTVVVLTDFIFCGVLLCNNPAMPLSDLMRS